MHLHIKTKVWTTYINMYTYAYLDDIIDYTYVHM
jgi:hypothetical protein